MKGRAEIVGGGFAGLTAACALAQRGWRVRLHERADRLRTAGAGINVYENGLRVLQAVGAAEETLHEGFVTKLRETRDEHDRLLSVHHWNISGLRRGAPAHDRRARGLGEARGVPRSSSIPRAWRRRPTASCRSPAAQG
mgnify:CR=1 FL=1